MDRRWLPLWSAVFLLVSAPFVQASPQVWSGRTFGFSKAPFANPTLVVNQDRITPTCWITRASTMGIYNIQQESGFTHSTSPKNTEWATGDAVNWASLHFSDWEDWAQSNPPSTIGVNACLHIKDADIYLDIKFTSWGELTGGGGAFSYLRAVSPPVPTLSTTWGRIQQLYR